MAREAGFVFDMTEPRIFVRYFPQDGFDRLVTLVRADEREACAKVCDELETCSDAEFYGHEFSAAIRARGNT
jgi:hypothetical protein